MSVTRVLLDDLRLRRAIEPPDGAGAPAWNEISPWPQLACCQGPKGKRRNVFEWGHPRSAVVLHFLYRLLENSPWREEDRRAAARSLMEQVWISLRRHDRTQGRAVHQILVRASHSGTFRLSPQWLRIRPAGPQEGWRCDMCGGRSAHSIRHVCPRNGCPGHLEPARDGGSDNHYRRLYESTTLPPDLRVEEHTAQIDSDEARQRQERFKTGEDSPPEFLDDLRGRRRPRRPGGCFSSQRSTRTLQLHSTGGARRKAGHAGAGLDLLPPQSA